MTTKSIHPGIRYLSAADIEACAIASMDVTRAVEAAFQEAARGNAETRSALHIPAGGLAAFRAKGGVLRESAYGGVKWYGYFPGNLEKGEPEYQPFMMLNAADTGFPVAIMNGDWITAQRTAAISAVGAKYLARPGSSRIGFIGCGGQARVNLELLQQLFPIASVVAHSRRAETAEIFAYLCRAKGITAEVAVHPEGAVSGVDIVVSSLPRLATLTPFLEADWLGSGGFISMVDVGRGWKREGVDALTVRITDEIEQEQGLAHITKLDASLADVVGGVHVGRATPEDRIALVCSGNGLADVAAAALVYERASELGIGKLLPH